jgi:hypothetical protein
MQRLLVANVLSFRFLRRYYRCNGEVVPVLNSLSTLPWRHMREWRYSSTIRHVSTRWRWVYPLRKKVNETWRWSGSCGEEKNLAQRKMELLLSIPLSVSTLTKLSRLSILPLLGNYARSSINNSVRSLRNKRFINELLKGLVCYSNSEECCLLWCDAMWLL